MAQVADLLITVGVDRKQAEAALVSLEKQLGMTAEQARKAGQGIDNGFSGLLKSFASSFRGDLGGVAGELTKATGKGQAFSHVMAGIAGGAVAGAVTAGLGIVGAAIHGTVEQLRDSVKAAAESEQAVARLGKSLSLVGQGAQTTQLAAFASAMAGVTLHTDEALMEVMQLGTSLNVPTGKLQGFTLAAANLASALGVDVNTAARQLAQTMDGDIGRLGRLVPELNGLTAAQLKSGEAIDLVGKKFAGMAQNDAASLQGALASVSKEMGELKEAFGVGLTKSGELQKGVSRLSDMLRGLRADAETAGETITQMFTTEDGKQVGGDWLKFLGVTGALMGGLLSHLRAGADSAEAARSAEAALAQRGGDGGGLSARHQEAARQAAAEDMYRRQEIHEKARLERLKQLGELQKEQEAQAKRATDELERQRKEAQAFNESIGDRMTLNDALLADGRSLYDSAADYAQALEAAGASTESIVAHLNAMVLSHKMAKEEALALRDVLRETDRDREIALAVAKRDAANESRAGDATQMGPEVAWWNAPDMMGPRQMSQLSPQEQADADAAAARAALDARKEEAQTIAELTMQLGDLGIAQKQYAATQAEATLQHDIEKWALLGVVDAHAQEIAARQRSIDAMNRQVEREKALAAQKRMTKIATLESAQATLGAAASAVGAVTKSAKAQMAIEAAQNVIAGITETAKSYASYAVHDYWGGTQHALAAVTHFAAASQAGKGGSGGGHGGSGGGGGGSDRAPRDQPGLDTYRSMRESEPQQRGPVYQVAITGTLLGGHPVDQARAIQSYLAQFASESANRPIPVRG